MSGQTIILDNLSALAEHLPQAARVLVLTTPGRRFVDDVARALPGRQLTIFDGARVHVPGDVVQAAAAVVREVNPEVLLTLGGGAATGLGKMLRLDHTEAQLVAVPTTFSGSEVTNIWGTTTEGKKRTGRDDRVRPTIVVHDAALVRSLPRAVAVQSLLNALAHPVSALAAGIDDDGQRRSALLAIQKLTFAARQMIRHHGQSEVQSGALAAAASAGRIIDTHEFGLHHKLAHALGGRHDLPHAALHALLLPHTLDEMGREVPDLLDDVQKAARTPNLAGFVHDALTRVDAPVSLRKLEVPLADVLELADTTSASRILLMNAWLGARPSLTAVSDAWNGTRVVVDGPVAEVARVVLALHGRGSNAARIAAQAREALGHQPDVVVVAPQADGDAWYPLPYHAPADELKAVLDAAVDRVAGVADEIKNRWPNAEFVLYGFSQGACLALEVAAREVLPFAHVLAIAGARPSGASDWPRSIDATSVYLSLAKDDPWVKESDVEATARSLEAAGAQVTYRVRAGAAHEVTDRDRLEVRSRLGVMGEAPRGFGGHHTGEALEGAVPYEQNSPRHSPYGLLPEQLSGTGFVAPRHENLRTWVYRVRPSAQHSPFEPVLHPTLTADLDPAPLINLEAWRAPALPAETSCDFVDGLITVGGAGHPNLRRGYAVHVYSANRDMRDRSFTSVDGDLLIMPEEGELTFLTELGVLEVRPGQILVMPRGLRFTVLLEGDQARGYVGEVYARHFHLPERGLIGANALADERHFVAPQPFYEDRLSPGYRMASKMGGQLYEATQDHSPYDVVGWHGSYLPYVYDTSLFAAVSNTRVDHADPSVFTVLSAGLDEQGAHALDLVVFPARWDATEHTFRPPYFHRNVTTEINGIVRDPTLSEPFEPGMVFVTPSMTAHGVRACSVDSYLAQSDDTANRPSRSSGRALWFQFETALPFCPSPWAKAAAERRGDWPSAWGEHGSYFDPRTRS